jgi:hypothetical protein
MASVNKLVLWDGAISGNTNGPAYSLEALQTGFVGISTVSALTATNVTVKIERSADGSTWFDWITFTAQTAPGSLAVNATTPGLSYCRATFTFTGGTVATAVIALHFDKVSK